MLVSSVAVTLYQVMRRRRGASHVLALPSERAQIEDLITVTTRRLQVLERQHAYAGTGTPPQVELEIEDLRRELAELERRREESEGNKA